MILRQAILLFTLMLFSCSEQGKLDNQTDTNSKSITQKETYDPSCQWCGANEAPDDVSWKTVIANENEPGDRIIISGTVFQEDGKTPAPNVIVYVYHTNNEGIYPKKGNEKGNGKRHGYLRGWMKTNENGQYQFESIRPEAYSAHGGEPAHIHYVMKAPEKNEYWLDALIFEGDFRITQENLKNITRDGGYGIITNLKSDKNGILRGQRNIRLKD